MRRRRVRPWARFWARRTEARIPSGPRGDDPDRGRELDAVAARERFERIANRLFGRSPHLRRMAVQRTARRADLQRRLRGKIEPAAIGDIKRQIAALHRDVAKAGLAEDP